MDVKKKYRYLETRREVRELYRDTPMKVSQIARLVRVSETTASKMIVGKGEPQWFKNGDYP